MKTVVAVGGFASLHKGHIELLEKTVNLAKKHNAESCVLTFDLALDKHKGNVNFMNIEQRINLIKKTGILKVVVQDFDEKFKELSPEEFFLEKLVKQLDCVCVVVGENFRFGRDASGNTETLKKLCEKNCIECEIHPLKRDEEDNVISTTFLTQIAKSGDMERFCKLLGRPLVIQGEVIHGRHEGTKIGFPTVNINVHPGEVTPGRGVYISETEIEGEMYPSVTNIGNAPTFDSLEELAETHIIGINKDLYGKCIKVNVYKKIRDITKFDSVEELKNQLKSDVIATIKYFNKQ